MSLLHWWANLSPAAAFLTAAPLLAIATVMLTDLMTEAEYQLRKLARKTSHR